MNKMKDLSDERAAELQGGASACVTSIAISASIGGLFGGAGALIGAVGAAIGPACLKWL